MASAGQLHRDDAAGAHRCGALCVLRKHAVLRLRVCTCGNVVCLAGCQQESNPVWLLAAHTWATCAIATRKPYSGMHAVSRVCCACVLNSSGSDVMLAACTCMHTAATRLRLACITCTARRLRESVNHIPSLAAGGVIPVVMGTPSTHEGVHVASTGVHLAMCSHGTPFMSCLNCTWQCMLSRRRMHP